MKSNAYIQKLLPITLIVVLLMGVLSSVACSKREEPVVLKMADAGWDSIRLHNSIMAYIINHGYDLATEQVSGTTAITWKAITEGDIQIYSEVWSENISSYESDVKAGLVKVVSMNFDDNAQGLYVPRYVIEGDPTRGIQAMAPDLRTVKDLLNYPEIFKDPEEPEKGRIYGAISGWDVDKMLNNKFRAYGFEESFNYFQPGSDAALAASLVSAYEKGEPWVGYYWAPTWISGQYDLVLLDDEPYMGDVDAMKAGLTEFPPNRVTVAIHPDLEKNHPQVAAFLSRYKTSSALTAAGLAVMNSEKIGADDAAILFMKKNQALWESWVDDPDVAQKINAALAKEG